MPRTRRTAVPRLAAALVAVPLAACGADRYVTNATYPADFRERHPITLVDAPETLDVFVTSARGIDARQRTDILAYAAEYRRHGKSLVTAYMPAGTGQERALHGALQSVRQVFSEAGVPATALTVARYTPTEPMLTAPIRLSYAKLSARVDSKCGEWPQDLASGSSVDGWKNRPYWNLGCAYQANFAAQVADPLDLARSRPEGRVDTIKRLNANAKLRLGQDPSTIYTIDATQISDAAGGN